MSGDAALTAFEAYRGQIFGLAYRMLGSAAEAEDVVQEAYLRWQAAPRDDVGAPRAFLARVVTNLAIDALTSARARREQYVGPWLPEPLGAAAADDTGAADPASLSLAFLLLLERLSPLERAAYLLGEVFDHDHGEVAAILGRSEAACRQLLSRARRHVRAGRPRFPPSREQHQRLLAAFAQACASGDLDALRRLLADDAIACSDGGGKAAAALRPIHGADRVARFFVGLSRKLGDRSVTIAEVNGETGLVVRGDGGVYAVATVEADGDRVRAVHVVVNPDKLRRW
jgi:RNA polymerase sigma-70 factor, ECF subfamily